MTSTVKNKSSMPISKPTGGQPRGGQPTGGQAPGWSHAVAGSLLATIGIGLFGLVMPPPANAAAAASPPRLGIAPGDRLPSASDPAPTVGVLVAVADGGIIVCLGMDLVLIKANVEIVIGRGQCPHGAPQPAPAPVSPATPPPPVPATPRPLVPTAPQPSAPALPSPPVRAPVQAAPPGIPPASAPPAAAPQHPQPPVAAPQVLRPVYRTVHARTAERRNPLTVVSVLVIVTFVISAAGGVIFR